MEDLKEIIKNKCYERAYKLYGKELPINIQARLDLELNSIINNNFEYIYIFMYRFCKKMKIDKTQIFIDWGTSSFISYLLDISTIDSTQYKLQFEIFADIKGDKAPFFGINIGPADENKVYEYILNVLKEEKLYIKINEITPNIKQFSITQDKTYLGTINLVINKMLSALSMMSEVTEVEISKIEIDYNNIMQYFGKFENIQINKLFEFDFNYLSETVSKIKPKNFDDLVKIISAIQGRGVWKDNVQNLIEKHNIKDIYCSREDVYSFLLEKGINKEKAFEIMEFIRKGKSLRYKGKWKEYVNIMKSNNIENWKIESFEKVKYMVSKANYYSYTLILLKLIWFRNCFFKEFENVFNSNI